MKTNNSIKTNRAVLDEILKSIEGIQYGEVTITLHDSRIVQIERKEKKRFEKGVVLYKNSCGK